MIAARRVHFNRMRRLSRRPAAFAAALVAFILVVLVAAPEAQQQTPAFSASGGRSAEIDTSLPTDINLLVGRSTVLNVGAPIVRVSLTVPDVADALVTAPGQLLIHGKTPGIISLFVWDKSGAITTYEVNVRRDLSELGEQLRQLFPGEPISVHGSGKDVVLAGTVSSKYVVEKAADVASGYVEKKDNVVNLLKQQEGVASNQVMLRVRFAEVSRSALQELGASFFTGPGGFHDYLARTTTQQFGSVNYDELTRSSIQGPDNWGGGRDTVDATGGKQTFSDLLNIFLFNNKYNVGTVIKALSEKGLFQSLAEPNLIATNGKEASFLAGGEYPYPVVQPGGAGNAVSITFKEFGIRLNFTPTVLGDDLINLKVKPEVSALDFANAVTLEGFRVPALSTRRTETEVELRDGQTFAIAGLMNNTVTDSMRKIPGIGDVPILGWLFKSKAMQKNQTELVVMITPTIVKRGQAGVSQSLPTPVEPYLGRPDKSAPNPEPYTGSPRYPASPGQGGDAPAPSAQDPSAMPVPSQPIQSSAALPPAPVAPAAPTPAVPVASGPDVAAMPATAVPAAPPADPQPTREQLKQRRAAEEQEKRAAEAEAKERASAMKHEADERAAAEKRAAAEQRAADQQAAEQRAAAEKRSADEQAAARKQAAAEQARQQREAEAQAAAQRDAQKKSDADARQAAKLAKERDKRAADVARENEERARTDAETAQKREKALNDAAGRLKAAQQAYEAELEKTEGGSQPTGTQPSGVRQ